MIRPKKPPDIRKKIQQEDDDEKPSIEGRDEHMVRPGPLLYRTQSIATILILAVVTLGIERWR